MQFRRAIPILLTAIFLLSSCGSKNGEISTSATNTEVAPTTTASPPIDVRSRAIPEHPDATYINAVLVELERVRGDVRREVWATQSMSQATYDRIDDIYDQRQGDIAKRIWSTASMTEDPLRRTLPGDDVATVKQIFDTRRGCAVFSIESDNSAASDPPTRPNPVFVLEIRYYEGDNRSNPTPWKYDYEASYKEENLYRYTCDQ